MKVEKKVVMKVALMVSSLVELLVEKMVVWKDLLKVACLGRLMAEKMAFATVWM